MKVVKPSPKHTLILSHGGGGWGVEDTPGAILAGNLIKPLQHLPDCRLLFSTTDRRSHTPTCPVGLKVFALMGFQRGVVHKELIRVRTEVTGEDGSIALLVVPAPTTTIDVVMTCIRAYSQQSRMYHTCMKHRVPISFVQYLQPFNGIL